MKVIDSEPFVYHSLLEKKLIKMFLGWDEEVVFMTFPIIYSGKCPI